MHLYTFDTYFYTLLSAISIQNLVDFSADKTGYNRLLSLSKKNSRVPESVVETSANASKSLKTKPKG